MRIELGLGVDCADGPCGTVRDVVIDPQRRIVTHVVVERHHDLRLARLVPVGDVMTGNSRDLILRSGTAALERYPQVEETAFIGLGEWPAPQDDRWEVGLFKVLGLPVFDTVGLEGGSYMTVPYSEGAYVAYDRIPRGEVELRRGSPVEAGDGKTVGHVDGLVIDGEGHITHLLLQRGHLWGRKEVTIPVAAVKRLRTDGVELELAVEDVVGSPSVWVGRRGRRARHGT